MDSCKNIFIGKIYSDMKSLQDYRYGESRICAYLYLLMHAADLSIKEKLALFEPDKFLKSKPGREVAKTG